MNLLVFTVSGTCRCVWMIPASTAEAEEPHGNHGLGVCHVAFSNSVSATWRIFTPDTSNPRQVWHECPWFWSWPHTISNGYPPRFFYFAYVSGERKQILLSARSTKQRPYPTFMSTNKLVPLLTYVIADVNRRSLTVLSLDYLRLSNSSRNLYRVINTISWLRNITHGCSVLLHVETLRIFLYIVSLSKAMDISVDVTLTGPTCHEEYSATRLLKVLAFSIQ